MKYIDSNIFSIKINREATVSELGKNGRVQSTVVIYKGGKRLIPVSSVPTEGEFRVTIKETKGCSASIKDLDTVYATELTSKEGVITLNIDVEGRANFVKNINLIKSLDIEETKNVETRIKIAEQKITNDSITNMVKEEFYTKNEVNTRMSVVEQTVDTWGVKIIENENEISSLKLTSEEFEVTIGNKADASNIISMINASTEGITISSSKVSIEGYVTFSDLAHSGSTVINGDNITSGTIRGREIISTDSDSVARVSMFNDGLRFYSPTMQAGKICFDGNGEGTEESATDRFLIESWNGYVLKLLSSGDMSISAKNYSGLNDIFIEANTTKIDNNTITTHLTSETFRTANYDIYMSYDNNYFPQVGSWNWAPCITMGKIALKAVSSLHLTTADGSSPATLFCENTNFSMHTSLAEPVSISSMNELTATDKINNLQINNTSHGYRIIWDNSMVSLSSEVETETKNTPTGAIVTTKISKDGTYVMSNVDAFTTISTLCKSIQELSARIVELENKLNK